jgi:hypothetical protein
MGCEFRCVDEAVASDREILSAFLEKSEVTLIPSTSADPRLGNTMLLGYHIYDENKPMPPFRESCAIDRTVVYVES